LSRDFLRSSNSRNPSEFLEGRGLLDTAGAAHFLGLSSSTLSYWRRRNVHRGPSYLKLHRHAVRYRVRDLEAWLKRRTVRIQETK